MSEEFSGDGLTTHANDLHRHLYPYTPTKARRQRRGLLSPEIGDEKTNWKRESGVISN
ncbi:MAG: hypothetical protein IH874_05260 [Candidatus Dadabacteria bacterium]|nr:hypothetical protein [Candidatus Dadabacteria bacterium]